MLIPNLESNHFVAAKNWDNKQLLVFARMKKEIDYQELSY